MVPSPTAKGTTLTSFLNRDRYRVGDWNKQGQTHGTVPAPLSIQAEGGD